MAYPYDAGVTIKREAHKKVAKSAAENRGM
nr:MAG TPA: hypothetical protein [Caudoviricetes sp.]